jgi:2'-5' RNA ligase
MTGGTHKFGLALPLDPSAQLRWQEFCRLLDRDGLRSMADFGYPAHLTPLVVTGADGKLVHEAFAAFAPRVGPIKLSIAMIGAFRTPQNVLWLGIMRSPPLIALQADLFAAFAALTISDFHIPSIWSPHITLATNIVSAEELDRAREIVQEAFEPFEASATDLELVQFPPPVVLASKPLGGRVAEPNTTKPAGESP